ncbi:hypothetical protein HYH03_011909 [Edaphochlamys debaryana]|uniref:Jacalin-type lectin domain-containing protein n=1 Tax=Edaphochlamys debaryana TaxID=47281 RepID=A0A835XTW3_9CHLO|nr:hypothetical protein HYH03_011909 [Edaphochlamys debaryana]|eukprot:KAG2489630.1 hypothetical protein HYH03_011909 [Edaphochlamys debaryana]
MIGWGRVNAEFRLVYEYGNGSRSSGESALTLDCVDRTYRIPQLYIEFSEPVTLEEGQAFVLQQRNLSCMDQDWEDVLFLEPNATVTFLFIAEGVPELPCDNTPVTLRTFMDGMCVNAGVEGTARPGYWIAQDPCVGYKSQVFIPERSAGGAYRFRSSANPANCWSVMPDNSSLELAPCAGGGHEQDFVSDNMRYNYKDGGGWKFFPVSMGMQKCVGFYPGSRLMMLAPADNASCIMDIIPAGLPQDLVPECAHFDALNGMIWRGDNYDYYDDPSPPQLAPRPSPPPSMRPELRRRRELSTSGPGNTPNLPTYPYSSNPPFTPDYAPFPADGPYTPDYPPFPAEPEPSMHSVTSPPWEGFFADAPPPFDYQDDYAKTPYLSGWADAVRPGQVLGLASNCELDSAPLSGGYGSLKMDGESCFGILPRDLVGWNTSSEAAFSIVVVYKLDASAGENALVHISRTPSDFDDELLFGEGETFVYDKGSYAMQGSIPSPPREQWIMASYVRQAGGKEGFMHVAYEGSSAPYMRTWSDAIPISVGADSFMLGADYRDWDKFLQGRIAVALVYNRSLDVAQLNRIYNNYGRRFNWSPQVLCDGMGLTRGPYGNRTGGSAFSDWAYTDEGREPITRVAWAVDDSSVIGIQFTYGVFAAPRRGSSDSPNKAAVDLDAGERIISVHAVLGYRNGVEVIDGLTLTTRKRTIVIGAPSLQTGITITPCPSMPDRMVVLQYITGRASTFGVNAVTFVWAEVSGEA